MSEKVNAHRSCIRSDYLGTACWTGIWVLKEQRICSWPSIFTPSKGEEKKSLWADGGYVRVGMARAHLVHRMRTSMPTRTICSWQNCKHADPRIVRVGYYSLFLQEVEEQKDTCCHTARPCGCSFALLSSAVCAELRSYRSGSTWTRWLLHGVRTTAGYAQTSASDKVCAG